MHPGAMALLVEGKGVEALLEEQVGKLRYQTVYLAIPSQTNSSINAVVAIPFFESEEELNSLISDVLGNVFNAFVVIFILFLIISFLVTKNLTLPFRLLTQKLKVTNLENNEPMYWSSKDEIGLLVNEYNQMLSKLEASKKVLASTEKESAWREMAKQVAHEIKNPLTPIQLSAERLGMKLADKLVGTDQTLLHKSVKTIVDQVDALQRLVNEFRDFGRLPQARLQALDLNHLLQEMMPLYDNDNALVPVSWHLNADIPLVSGDAAQLRQVVHNLIQNAQDASAQSTQPMVHVWTEQAATSQRVRLRIVDNGIGFSDSVLQRAFEPYVTTKAGGTGLGLAVVKKIADEHQARIEIKNRLEGDETVGAQVSLSFRIANPAS
jgi:nitrogen fixation/metabolism regulation signal transduction histidine kinase